MLMIVLRTTGLLSLACLMTYLAGKDANWDLLNYHLYIAHAWAHDKFLTDFMAAGPNSYFNPFGYLPFYWMVMADWHSLAIGLVLGAFHGLSLIILWELSAHILFKDSPYKQWFTLLSVLLAAASPVFAGTVGGTFLEPTLTVFVLGGLLAVALGCDGAMLGNKQIRNFLLIFVGGVLAGLATGFKLTNIVFLAAIGISILCIMGLRIRGLTIAAIFSIGSFLGYAIANGWWAYQLYKEFGNPLFPFFNEIFLSPDFSISKLDHDRFKPTSVVDVLLFPFRMALFHSWIYVENNAPDLRAALLVLFSIGAIARLFFTKIRDKFHRKKNATPSLGIVVSFFLLGTALWLWTTGNGRYALPLLLLLGPLLVFAIYKSLIESKRALMVACIALIFQTMHAVAAGNPRWSDMEWTPHWFETKVAAKLKENPYAYLSMGVSRSNSVIAPFLHPQSSYVSLIGGPYAFRPDGAGSKRINAFIKSHESHLRMLITIPSGHTLPSAGTFNAWDRSLAPWHLKTVRSDCEFLDMYLEPEKIRSDNPAASSSGSSSQIPMLSCALTTGPGEDEETLAERKRLTAVFDQIEETCPLLFSPRGWHLTKSPSGWQRSYLKSDMVVYARKGRLSLSKFDFGPFDVDMGSIEDWENNRSSFVCQRQPKPW